MLNVFNGWMGEKATQLGMCHKLDNETDVRFHDLTISTGKTTTQIDHVVLSKFDLFVIETKNYNGWIFGGEKQKTWTQVRYGKKYKFQNPLHQNYMHTKALSRKLKINHSIIHSIVFFIGDATFKTEMPSNVIRSGL
jgi:hypothetical protein